MEDITLHAEMGLKVVALVEYLKREKDSRYEDLLGVIEEAKNSAEEHGNPLDISRKITDFVFLWADKKGNYDLYEMLQTSVPKYV